MTNQTPRILQQQPQQENEKPQAKQQQMGEGSYEGTRDYNQRQAEYQKTHDVQTDAEAAKPRSEEEARELRQAEDEGKSHSKGEH